MPQADYAKPNLASPLKNIRHFFCRFFFFHVKLISNS